MTDQPIRHLPPAFEVQMPDELVALDWVELEQQVATESMFRSAGGGTYVSMLAECSDDALVATRQRFAVRGVAVGHHPTIGIPVPPELGGEPRTHVIVILAFTPWNRA